MWRSWSLCVFLVLFGCAPLASNDVQDVTAQVTAIPTPVPTSIYVEQIDHAEQLWKSQNITSYRIKLSLYENFGGLHDSVRAIEVRNGKVTTPPCQSEDCPAFVLKDIQTVDNLFSVARGGTLPEEDSSLDECLHDLAFDSVYGFPTSISIDCPQSSDEENSIKVISFEVLK